MKDDKIRFIMGLLNNPNTTPAQKEKINELLSKEHKNESERTSSKRITIIESADIDFPEDFDIIADGDIIDTNPIEIIDKSIDELSDQQDKEIDSLEIPPKPEKRSIPSCPKDTRDFLYDLFKGEEGTTKNTTHSFNLNYIEYEELMKECCNQYNKGLKDHPYVATRLLSRVWQFLFSKETDWFIRDFNKIDNSGNVEKVHYKIGWSTPEFVEWYKEKKIHPCDDSYYNTKMINPFKDSIEIRIDANATLTSVIKKIYYSIFGTVENLKIDKDVKEVHFFTDTDLLYSCISMIFNNIKKMNTSNIIHVSQKMDYEGHHWAIFICHVGTRTGKNAYDTEFEGGNIHNIKNQLYGLCNYDIVSEFGDGYTYKRTILSDKKGEEGKVELLKEDVEGFTHVLKFY